MPQSSVLVGRGKDLGVLPGGRCAPTNRWRTCSLQERKAGTTAIAETAVAIPTIVSQIIAPFSLTALNLAVMRSGRTFLASKCLHQVTITSPESRGELLNLAHRLRPCRRVFRRARVEPTTSRGTTEWPSAPTGPSTHALLSAGLCYATSRCCAAPLMIGDHDRRRVRVGRGDRRHHRGVDNP
jgi:hypothetical protein